MLPPFELYQPASLAEACALKAGGAKPFAGGTDVLVSMHGGHEHYPALVDLKGIAELSGITFDPAAGAALGALTTHRAIEHWPEAEARYTALHEGCSQVGSVQTRVRGTLGGNLCNAAPSGDSIGPLFVLGARLELAGQNGRRTLPIEDFFPGPKRTVLAEDELLARILLPPPEADSGSAYYKYTRRNAMDLALMGVAAWVRLNEAGDISAVRLALTTSAPTVMRASAAEGYLTGKTPDGAAFAQAARLATEQASPRTSWRASREFRLKLIENLVPRVLKAAVERAQKSTSPKEGRP